MEVQKTTIPDVLVLMPKKFGDHRGFFSEVYSREALRAAGVDLEFVQDNHSMSAAKGVLRGLHFQRPPFAQDKLVRVVRGSILDVVVDIRKGSPTYGKHVSVVISAENWKQVFVPVGFAHGFVTLEPGTEVIYKVSARYAPECDAGVLWSDPDLAINWGIDEASATLSDKDRKLPRFADFESPFTYPTTTPAAV